MPQLRWHCSVEVMFSIIFKLLSCADVDTRLDAVLAILMPVPIGTIHGYQTFR